MQEGRNIPVFKEANRAVVKQAPVWPASAPCMRAV